MKRIGFTEEQIITVLQESRRTKKSMRNENSTECLGAYPSDAVSVIGNASVTGSENSAAAARRSRAE